MDTIGTSSKSRQDAPIAAEHEASAPDMFQVSLPRCRAVRVDGGCCMNVAIYGTGNEIYCAAHMPRFSVDGCGAATRNPNGMCSIPVASPNLWICQIEGCSEDAMALGHMCYAHSGVDSRVDSMAQVRHGAPWHIASLVPPSDFYSSLRHVHWCSRLAV